MLLVARLMMIKFSTLVEGFEAPALALHCTSKVSLSTLLSINHGSIHQVFDQAQAGQEGHQEAFVVNVLDFVQVEQEAEDFSQPVAIPSSVGSRC